MQTKKIAPAYHCTDIGGFNYRLATIIWFTVIVYGSLIPFDVHSKNINESIQFFLHIPYLNLGKASRADWIANILLYVPLTFFANGWLQKKIAKFSLRNILILTCSLLISVSIEYSQQFFPPRTVSLNDLLAEGIGSIIGITIWFFLNKTIKKRTHQLFTDKKSALQSLLILYIVIYLFFSLFPFDFLISSDELSSKFTSQYISWFIVTNACVGTSRCLIKILTEILFLVPVGFLYCSIAFNKIQSCRLIVLISLGLLVSIVIEAIQFFIASGITQGISVFTRILGLILGYQLFKINQKNSLFNYIINKKVLLLFFIPLYLCLIILSRKLSTYSFSQLITIEEKFDTLSLIPFYYHYYTTETIAMVSLLSNFLLYLPIGIFFGLWHYHNNLPKELHITLFTTLIIALIIEASTLLFSNQHAEPTNILIALMASFTGLFTIHWIKTISQNHLLNTKEFSNKQPIKSTPADTNKFKTTTFDKINNIEPESQKHFFFGQIQHRILSIIGLIIIIISLINFPIAPVFIGLFLLIYAILIWYNNNLWLLVVPAALPVVDLAPLSGHFYWDSIDLLLLTTVVVLFWKGVESKQTTFNNRKLNLLILIISLSWLVSTLTGLNNASTFDTNAFTSELSPYNALRIAKGYFWAVLFIPFLFASLSIQEDTDKLLIRGLALGLLGTSLAVIWERHLFAGLFNFTNDFRVTGTFSSMHTGGGHIETYLVLVLAIIINALRQPFSQKEKFIYLGIISIGLYSLLVTYARAGYIAFALSLIVLTIPIFVQLLNRQKWGWPQLATGFISILFFAALIQSPYVQQRFSTTAHDLQVRIQHWSDAISIMDDSYTSKLFGMGLGQYPRIYSQKNPKGLSLGSFHFISKAENTWLQLHSGQTMYFEQVINLQPDTIYLLTFDILSNEDKSRVTMPICEKAMLYSFHCEWISINNNNSKGKWVTKVNSFSSKSFQIDSILSRPVKISLYNPQGKGSTINIDNISITDNYGNELIKNGDFEKGMDHWFYSTDNHLPWHTKQLGVQLYFSQGITGLILFLLLCAVVVFRAWIAAINGNIIASGFLAGIIAFLVTGVFSSIFDAPRLTLLFFILMFYTLIIKVPDSQNYLKYNNKT